MSDKVAEITAEIGPSEDAQWVVTLWDRYNNQRSGKLAEVAELEEYIYATDTTSTSNSLSHKNSTTLPKICQIRDNLHSNYMSTLFDNDKWLQWNGYTEDSATKEKAETITSYMDNKAREGGLREVASLLVYDYIDFGNWFVMPSFESRNNIQEDTIIPGFIGPRSIRINPRDIVFNPLANCIEDTHKIVRSVKTIGELKKLAMISPEQAFWGEATERRHKIRQTAGGYSVEDFNKAAQFANDGFGNLYEYYQSDYVEVLEFYGDFHNQNTGELEVNRVITIIDRAEMIRNEPINTYSGRAPIRHASWRKRSDNLWGMGPLDNLVGMQYRLDHIQNIKADAWDMAIDAPRVIEGNVESMSWGMREEIHIDEGGSVTNLSFDLNPILVGNNETQFLMDQMELMAGAPREAMGIRSPGEKTAFEVQTLDNAAGRIFQQKAINFEIAFERHLNDMLEIAVRNMDGNDVIRVLDDDLKVIEFRTITKTDLTAKGILRPIGARHFAQKAQELQNLVGIFNSPIAGLIAPHTSGLTMTKYVEDVLDLRGYSMFKPNIAVIEQQETQALVNQATEDNMAAQETQPLEGGVADEEEPI